MYVRIGAKLMTVVCIPIEKSDIKEIVDIHNIELNGSVLALFGPAFVRRMYLNLLKEGNWGFVAKVEGDVVGFIFATKSEVSLLRCLSITSAICFLFNSIRNPLKFISFFVAFKEFCLGNSSNKTVPTETMIELSLFAVREDWKTGGIGKTLIGKLEGKAKASGFSNVFTRTHNYRLLEYYIKSKNAIVLKRISLVTYDSLILKWQI